MARLSHSNNCADSSGSDGDRLPSHSCSATTNYKVDNTRSLSQFKR
ncbi:hypothetical protein [Nostoc sp. CALU 546]